MNQEPARPYPVVVRRIQRPLVGFGLLFADFGPARGGSDTPGNSAGSIAAAESATSPVAHLRVLVLASGRPVAGAAVGALDAGQQESWSRLDAPDEKPAVRASSVDAGAALYGAWIAALADAELDDRDRARARLAAIRDEAKRLGDESLATLAPQLPAQARRQVGEERAGQGVADRRGISTLPARGTTTNP